MENELFQLLFTAEAVKCLIVPMCFSDQEITLQILVFFQFSYTFYHQHLVYKVVFYVNESTQIYMDPQWYF